MALLSGIVPPLVTPLASPDRLDEPGLDRLIEHVLAGGVHGLFVLGTTGEAPSLSHRLQRQMVEASSRIVAGRVPLLVGITDTSIVESIALAEFAADRGADYVVVAPPYYFAPGQPELLAYLEELVPRLPLPLFLYNMPAMTKVSIDTAVARRAADLPGVVGIKDSSGDMQQFHRYLRIVADRPDFRVFMGPEQLLAESVLLGGHGGVAGGANLFPRLFVDLYHAAQRGDLPAVRSLQTRVMELDTTLYSVGRYGSGFIKAIKTSLGLLGICSDITAQPFQRFAEPERKRIREHLLRFTVWEQAPAGIANLTEGNGDAAARPGDDRCLGKIDRVAQCGGA